MSAICRWTRGAEHRMVNVAPMAYQQDRSLVEIVQDTGRNRWQVSRLLREARDLGVARLAIVPRSARRTGLEIRRQDAFARRDGVVMPNDPSGISGIDAVARAGGQYLASVKPPARTIGVSWGRTG